MAWIDTVPPEHAEGALAELYHSIAGARGGVAERAASATPDDLSALRAHGFDDRALLDAALTIGYFCFVNRLVLVLGVHLEEDYERTCGPDMAAAPTA